MYSLIKVPKGSQGPQSSLQGGQCVSVLGQSTLEWSVGSHLKVVCQVHCIRAVPRDNNFVEQGTDTDKSCRGGDSTSGQKEGDQQKGRNALGILLQRCMEAVGCPASEPGSHVHVLETQLREDREALGKSGLARMRMSCQPSLVRGWWWG